VTVDDVKLQVRNYIAQQFLAGEDPASLTDQVKLVSDGIIDSLGSLKLVSWLEERFDVAIEAHEVDAEHLDSVSSIAALVTGKQG
jgi:acyl carrier protein